MQALAEKGSKTNIYTQKQNKEIFALDNKKSVSAVVLTIMQ
jgi:hypothetical protein